MRTHLLLQLLMVAVLAPTWAYAGPPGLPSGGGPQSEPVRKGVGHFDKAFFDLTPHKRDLEASHEYDLAIAEFQRELAVRPASTEAHAYLARIYYLRNQLNKAASHYDQLTALDPYNIDGYVLAALAYAEDGNIAAARIRLETAKHQTTDPSILSRLDEYLAKLPATTP